MAVLYPSSIAQKSSGAPLIPMMSPPRRLKRRNSDFVS